MPCHWGKTETETDSNPSHGVGQGHIVLLTKTHLVLLCAGVFWGHEGTALNVHFWVFLLLLLFFLNTTQISHFIKVGNENTAHTY